MERGGDRARKVEIYSKYICTYLPEIGLSTRNKVPWQQEGRAGTWSTYRWCKNIFKRGKGGKKESRQGLTAAGFN